MGHYTLNKNKEELERDLISSVRISKILDYLTKENPTLIPFKMKFPILNELDYNGFSKVVMGYPKYEDLPKFIKEKVEIAEKVKFYDVSFKNFLQLRKISENEFKNKNPKTKLDILYEWLFENKLDVGVLDM